MGRQIIELVQVLVDRIHQGGYTQRALEDDIYAESQKRIAAEKDRDHWKQARQEAHEAGELMKAEIETLRKELDAAKRAASDEITERQVLTVEQQQDAAIWQQQLDAARAEIETLKGAMAADDRRLRNAEERIWPGKTWGCAAPDLLADEILHLREQLDAATERTPVAEPLDAENDTCPGN